MARLSEKGIAPVPGGPRARFYYTVGPQDFTRQRLVPGSHAMLVASALWTGKQLGYRTPPDCLASLVLDSGGFQAARKWGAYPWDAAQYAHWGQRYQASGVPLTWLAILDFACEHGVNRAQHATNAQRIQATLTNAARCRDAAPDLPWLPVVQGYTLDEYGQCIEGYQREGWDLRYCGLGTMCGRPVRQARSILRGLRQHYPTLVYHVFGMHLGVLDDAVAARGVHSWDSYAWDWVPNGAAGRAAWRRRQRYLPGWTYSREVRARAEAYGRLVQHVLTQGAVLPLFKE